MTPAILAAQQANPTNLVVDATNVYWVNWPVLQVQVQVNAGPARALDALATTAVSGRRVAFCILPGLALCGARESD